MSGVQTGSKLEQLERLLARVQHEITVERRRLRLDAPDPRGGVTTHPGVSIADLVHQPRPSAAEVRRWAKTHGLRVGDRGRVPEEMYREYERQQRGGHG